jgi:hypothetical protein
MNIKYDLEFDNGEKLSYNIDADRGINKNKIDFNEFPWVHIRVHKCDICTLKNRKNSTCPAAADIAFLIPDFSTAKSYDRVKVTVTDSERTYYKECDLQTALNSMLGLILATSGCPVLSKLKYMAYFHLPFASYEESFTRTVGFYLIKQLLSHRKGDEADYELKELIALYNDLRIINTNLHKRLMTVCNTDANVNAIHAFFSLSTLIQLSLNENLDDIQNYFI